MIFSVHDSEELPIEDLDATKDVIASEYEGCTVVIHPPESEGYQKMLREETLGSNVKDAQYDDRYFHQPKEVLDMMNEGERFPFAKLTPLNVGDPAATGQQPITFHREFMAGACNASLLKPESTGISEDAKRRVKLFERKITWPIGAYTANTKGYDFIREAVAQYIYDRDGQEYYSVYYDNIYLTNGTQEGIRHMLHLLLRHGSNDAVMMPVPHDP